MKKTFLFLAAVMLSLSSFAVTLPEYKTPADTWTVGDTQTLEAVTWNSVTVNKYSVFGDWYSFSVYTLYKTGQSKLTWIDFTNSGSTTKSWSAMDVFQSGEYYTNDGKTATANLSETPRVYSYQVTNMKAVSLYGNAGDNRTLVLAVVENGELVASETCTGNVDQIITINDLDVTKTYVVVVYGESTSNSNLYGIAFSATGDKSNLTPKAVAPQFSVAAKTYYEPFKVGIYSADADAIYYSYDNTDYVEYTDSLLVDDFDNPTTIYAFATKEGADNSDTVSVTYTLSNFVPRTIFNARKTLEFGGITADDVVARSGDNVTFGVYSMDGTDCPSVTYLHLNNEEGTDSAMILSFAQYPELTIRYKNGSDKANAIKFAKNYAQLDSKNFELWIDGVQGGDTIVFVVTAKGGTLPVFDNTYSSTTNIEPYQPYADEEAGEELDPNYTDGKVFTESGASVENDFEGWTNLVYTVKPGKTSIKLKETAGGYRLAKIQIGAYRGEQPQAVNTVAADNVQAVKVVENGQVYIIKNGVKYNALGTVVTE